MAVAVAAAQAIADLTGQAARLKWPNDLVWPGDGSGPDRKLAGILAEAIGDAVVVGIGVNLHWEDVPEALAEIATACNLEGGRSTTRESVLAAFLAGYAGRLADLTQTRADYEARLVTVGRRVRVEQASGALVGVAHHNHMR